MLFKNLALGYVDTAPSPAASGTSLVLAAGEGARFPQPSTDGSFYITVCPAGEDPHLGNSEICLVTARSTDTLTIVRAERGTSARTIVIGDRVLQGVYVEDIINVNSLFRQALINGNLDVWQRGTSIAMTTANAYSADRWYVETATAGTDKTISRQDGTGVEGSRYCARVAMVQDVDELLTLSQALETQDSIMFRGKKLTLSFYARGGAEFVADNATLVCKIVTGKGTDQKVLSFTTSADAVSENKTLTTGWQKFTLTTTAAIASDITQIGVSFAFTHAGAGVTTNYFEVTQVQLCEGDVALPFQPKSFADELRAAQRYYQNIGNSSVTLPMFSGMVWGTAGELLAGVPLVVPLRTTPTYSVDFIRALRTTTTGVPALEEIGTTAPATITYSEETSFVYLKWTGLDTTKIPAYSNIGIWGRPIFSAEL